MIKKERFLIIVGTNRNAGKTTFGCSLIAQHSASHLITGIKISPHFHPLEKDDKIIEKTSGYVIVEETKKGSGKDSSRMLDAGAGKVFYIQVWDENLENAMKALMPYIDPQSFVIIESGWARTIFQPGVFLILNRKDDPITKTSIEAYKSKADLWINFDGHNFDFDPALIIPTDEGWKILKK